jgi:hypothetical protein
MTHYHPHDSRDVYSEEQERRLRSYEERKPEDDIKAFFSARKDSGLGDTFSLAPKATPAPAPAAVAAPVVPAATSSSTCGGCGQGIQSHWKFCNKCGFKLAV